MTFEIPQTIVIDDGTYPGVLERVESDQGQFGTFRKWHWLVDHDGKVDPLSVITSGNTGPQSKSYKWLTALLGRAPQAGEKLETPAGTRVLLKIGHNEKGFATVLEVLSYSEPQQVMEGVPR